jgi:RNA polymerase sigma-70 factor (ECF subfamily)
MKQSPEELAQDLANITAALNGDSDAFDRIMDKYDRYIFNLCWRVTLNEQDAADLTQETFLKLYTHLKDFKSGQNFSNWLYTIALNDCRKHLRRKKIIHFFSYSQDSEFSKVPFEEKLGSEKEMNQSQTQILLHRITASLPEGLRPVFILRYFEDMSEEEISQVTGITMNNVRVRIHRARRFLWEKYGDLIKDFL